MPEHVENSSPPELTRNSVSRPRSAARTESVALIDRRPAANHIAQLGAVANSAKTHAPRRPSLEPVLPVSRIVQRVIKNSTAEVQFFSLLKSIRMRDENYYYLYHGTFADNLDGIRRIGLDPGEGGGERGASRHEGRRSADSIGLIKYSTDPNIATVYAKSAAEAGAVGVLLQARVKIEDLKRQFNDGTHKGDPRPFWRRERGGENTETRSASSSGSKLALNEAGGPGAVNQIHAVETNILVPPEDISIVGFYLPPGIELDEVPFMAAFGQIEATVIDFDQGTVSKIYTAK
jgi:hypothetical protein